MPKPSLPLHIANALGSQTVALVAGGASFLGSHLCEKLLQSCKVICLDNLSSGKRENILPLLTNDRFTFIEYDIAKPLRDLLRAKVDYVFHVAGIEQAQRPKKASLNDLLVNSYGTRNLLEKALSDGAKFLLVSTLEHKKQIDEFIDTAQARLFSESMTAEYIKKFGLDARILRVGELFGPGMPLDERSTLGTILKGLVWHGKVSLTNSQEEKIYPLFVGETISLILHAMFAHGSAKKIFNLLPKQSVALAEVAEILMHINPDFSIHFQDRAKAAKTVQTAITGQHHTSRLFSQSSKEEFASQLNETVKFFQKNQSPYEIFDTAAAQTEKKEKTSKAFPARFALSLFAACLIVFSTLIPLLVLCVASLWGFITLNSAYSLMREGKFAQSVKDAEMSASLFTVSSNALNLFFPYLLFARSQAGGHTVSTLLKSGQDGALATSHLANTAIYLGDFFRESVKGEKTDLLPMLNRAIGELNTAANALSFLQKEIGELESLSLPTPLSAYVKNRHDILSEQRDTIALVQTLGNVLPDLLGFDGKRVYLVLLQNNMELRPTGGFIGSYGLLSFEKGRLLSFDIFDVYLADGQLKGHVDPPKPIRTILHQPNWFLRDSNWDPDFQASATQAAWFLQKETDISVHGVIAVDTSLAGFLLRATGPIPLSDYKETITADNLFEKTQTHVEADFFPGSTKKKDFLGALGRNIIDRLLYGQNTQWLPIFSALKRGVAEKHLLFSFNNPSVQQVFVVNNWAGSLLTFEQGEGKLNDFRMINEANLGVNKANFFVKRKISDEIVIDEQGNLAGTLSILYANEGSQAFPGGPYVNYLRTFFPKGTKLTAITIDGQEASISGRVKGVNGGIDLDEATQSARTVFGFPLTVAPHTTRAISLAYQIPVPFPMLPGSNTYAYVFQKQPGILEDPLSITVHYPQSLRLKNTNAQVFREKQNVTISTNLAEDRLILLELVK